MPLYFSCFLTNGSINSNRGAFVRVSWTHRGTFATTLKSKDKWPGLAWAPALRIDRAIKSINDRW